MLETLRVCPGVGDIQLSSGFQKGINWFCAYLQCTTGMYIMHADSCAPRSPFVDACGMGAGAIFSHLAYHTKFLPQFVGEDNPICHLDAVNAMAALRSWLSQPQGCLIHLHMDNSTEAALFQLSRGG